MNAQEIRGILRAKGAIGDDGFEVLRSISLLLNSGLSDDANVARELVIRALDRRQDFEGLGQILDALVRNAGLYPYLDVSNLESFDLFAYEMHRPDGLGDEIVFHRVQAEIYRDILSGDNIVLSAPTSFGKSLIIDAIVASKKFKNIVLIVPTIALIDETRRRMAQFRDTYAIITHNSQHRGDRNIFVLTQERALERTDLDEVDFFVIDEFYKLGAGAGAGERDERAIALNVAFSRLFHTGAQFYLLGPNIQTIPDAFQEKYNCRFLYTDYNTVAAEIHRHTVEPGSALDELSALCSTLTDPTLIYCKSPKSARAVVQHLAANLTDIAPEPALERAAAWLGREFHEQWRLVKGLKRGIGLHHGKIPRSVAQYQVRAFNAELLRFLVCTSTLIEGVNTAAKNVIIYDNKLARTNLDFFTFSNIKGRSGRMFKHFVGHVYLFHAAPQQELPHVEIPVASPSSESPLDLLIQLDDNELPSTAMDRIAGIKEHRLLSVELLRANALIDPEKQCALAEQIESEIPSNVELLNWRQLPKWEQLGYVCDLIWKYFLNGRGDSVVKSPRQLTFLANRAKAGQSVRELITSELEKIADPDDEELINEKIDEILDWMRTWETFHLPRYLRALDRIQRVVLEANGHKSGDYTFFASRLEAGFLPGSLASLDEYGIPPQLAIKISDQVELPEDFEELLEVIASLDVDDLELDEFERELLTDTLESL